MTNHAVGFLGLGRMGYKMAERLAYAGYRVVGYDVVPKAPSHPKFEIVSRLEQIVVPLPRPRVIFSMVPASAVRDLFFGEPTDAPILILDSGDYFIDGSNQNPAVSRSLHENLKRRGIHYVDVGCSGGIAGASRGLSMTVGGDREDFVYCWDIFNVLAIHEGLYYVGSSGAGHYAKMVRNAIAYGFLAALGEGVELLARSPYDFQVAEVLQGWAKSSVVRSWLVELASETMKSPADLEAFYGVIGGGEAGAWTLAESLKLGVPMPILSAAIAERLSSRQSDPLRNRLIAKLRKRFGGHDVVTRK